MKKLLCIILSITMLLSVVAVSAPAFAASRTDPATVHLNYLDENISKVKEYVLNNGEYVSNTNHYYVTMTSENDIKYFIRYYPADGLLKFETLHYENTENTQTMSSSTINFTDSASSFVSPCVNAAVSYNLFEYTSSGIGVGQTEARAVFTPLEYTYEDGLSFEITKNTGASASSVISNAQSVIKATVVVFNYYLLTNIGIPISSIGFTQLCQEHDMQSVVVDGNNVERCSKCGHISSGYSNGYVPIPQDKYDINEPNNSQEAATPLELGKTCSGEIGSYKKYSNSGNVLDHDWFKIDLTEGKTYRFNFENFYSAFSGTTLIIHLIYPDESSTSASVHMTKDGSDYFDFVATYPGTYYFHFYNYCDYKTKAEHPYSFSVTNINPIEAPKNIETTPSKTAIDVSWNSVLGAAGYKVQCSANSDFSDAVEVDVTTTNATVPNLNSSTKYYIRVCSYKKIDSAKGCSEWVNTYAETGKINTGSFDDDEPNDSQQTATPLELGEIHLAEIGSYTKFNNSGNAIDHDWFRFDLTENKVYRFYFENYYSNFGGTHLSVSLIYPDGSEESVSIPMKKVASDYYDFVAPESGTYYLHFYNYFDNTTKKDHPYSISVSNIKVLNEPKNLNLTAASTSINLSWDKVTGAKGYIIQYSTKSDFSDAEEVTSETNSATVTGLECSTKYYFRVCAYKIINIREKAPSDWINTSAKTGSKENSHMVGEPNNTKAKATTLKLGKATKGELGSYERYREYGSDADWFKIKLTANNVYRIYLSDCSEFWYGNHAILELIDASGKEKTIHKDMARSGNDYYEFTANKTGTYYLHFYSYTDTRTKTDHFYTITVKDMTAVGDVSNVKTSAKSKGFKVSWSKASGASGYQIQYSTSSKFSSAKSVTTTSTSKTVKKLKAKKKYYVRVRAYKTYKGKKYYSKWVSTSVKTKK